MAPSRRRGNPRRDKKPSRAGLPDSRSFRCARIDGQTAPKSCLSARGAANRVHRVLANEVIEEVSAGAILDLDQPEIGIEPYFARHARLGLARRYRPPSAEQRGEQPVDRSGVLE